MLHTLRIKNLALVADLTLDLPEGLSVLTGETGAGKSIILGAVNLLLGQRADRASIRSGADSCTVEAVFDIQRLKAPIREFLESNGLEPCEESELTLKRVFSTAGSNRQFVNGTPTTLAVLSTLGEWLVDLHGPHDHQSLLYPARQLDILDAFGGLDSCRKEYLILLQNRSELLAEKRGLVADDLNYARELDLLRFQAEEISAARLMAGEDAALAEEHHRASNASRILEQSQSALELLSESDTAVLSQIGILGRTLHELKRLDPAAGNSLELQESIAELLRELQRELSRFRDRIQIDPERLAELEERLNLLQSLKRKYGPRLEDVIETGCKVRERLTVLNSRDAELGRLSQALAAVHERIFAAGKKLSSARERTRQKLAQAVTLELQELGFKQSHFNVVLTPSLPELLNDEAQKLNPSGFDQIEFQFAPNPGEPPRPLRLIASSGEMARVMLAIKTVLARVDDVPVLIFDEVDANVGGETARTVGAKMRQISLNHQVVCISHSALVAAQARTHFLVSKFTRDGRTASRIETLDAKSRVDELARMLGGGGDAAIQLAETLLNP